MIVRSALKLPKIAWPSPFNQKEAEIKQASTNLSRSPRALSFYEEENKESRWTDYN